MLLDGMWLTYKFNGFRVLAVIAVAGAIGIKVGWFDLVFVYDNFLLMFMVMVVLVYVLLVYLYVSSFAKGKTFAKGGNSGNAVYDFFIGCELNLRILNGVFDLKVFCEFMFGLIGWLLLDLGFVAK